MRWTLGLATLGLGCNQLIGVHEYSVDAASDACPTCECTIDSDCTDLHAVCDHDQCTCSAGYALGADGCVWVGVIDDPGFERSPDRWVSVIGQTTLTPSAPQAAGMQDPGYVVIPSDSTCRFGTLSQAVTMPRFSRSESLVVSATYAADSQGLFGGSVYPTVGLAASWYESSYPRATLAYNSARRMCLGEGQYAPETSTGIGAGVAVNLTAYDLQARFCQANKPSTMYFDHVEVLPAAPGECPLPGQVTNGDVEGNGGWSLAGAASIAPCPTGGHCIAIAESVLCNPASANILLSVPLATQTSGATLSIDHAAGGAATATDLALYVDSAYPLQVGAGTTDSYCLPAYMRGGVYPLQAGYNRCVDAATIYVDNVRLTNVPACGADPYLADPSFESGFKLIYSAAGSGGSVANVSDPNGAYPGGLHDLHLQVAGACASYAQWHALPTVPSSIGKPALKFHYKWSGQSSATFSTTPAPLAALTTPTAWTAAEVCLDPKLAGRAQDVAFTLQQPSPTTCPTTTESVYLDELSVVDEPNCP